MYYNRTLSDSFSRLIEPKGNLRWLFNFIKDRDELDFLIGKNANQEWISVYRGLSKVLTIKNLKREDGLVKVDGTGAYKNIMPSIYGRKSVTYDFSSDLEELIKIVSTESRFDRYYNNLKEGYYQNELSRKYGILGSASDEFVVVDKEATVGYKNQKEKDETYALIQETYKDIQREISATDEKRYGKNLDKKAIGNELDFLALDKNGRLLLIEFKDGKNTAGIYLSPLQIGMYMELFAQLSNGDFEKAVIHMIEQKQRIGLINKDWNVPAIKEVVPVLINSNYSEKSCAKKKFHEIMSIARTKKGDTFLGNLETYNYTTESGLVKW